MLLILCRFLRQAAGACGKAGTGWRQSACPMAMVKSFHFCYLPMVHVRPSPCCVFPWQLLIMDALSSLNFIRKTLK